MFDQSGSIRHRSETAQLFAKGLSIGGESHERKAMEVSRYKRLEVDELFQLPEKLTPFVLYCDLLSWIPAKLLVKNENGRKRYQKSELKKKRLLSDEWI